MVRRVTSPVQMMLGHLQTNHLRSLLSFGSRIRIPQCTGKMSEARFTDHDVFEAGVVGGAATAVTPGWPQNWSRCRRTSRRRTRDTN